MLNPRLEKSPETRHKTPKWFSTSADIVCFCVMRIFPEYMG